MAEWPTRGQQAPDFWDVMLKTYIDEGDFESVKSSTIIRVERMTRSEYDALDPKVATTLYVVVPDSELLVNGTYTPQGYTEAVVVGTGPVLADDSDATYVGWNSWEDLDFNVGIEPLDGDISAITGLSLTMRVSVGGGDDAYPGTFSQCFLFLQDSNPSDNTGDFYVGQFRSGSYNTWQFLPTVPLDETITDVTLPLALRPGKSWADILAVLQDNPQFTVNAFENDASSTPGVIRIYEAYLTYTTA